eukprot:gene7604-22435_t
MSQACANGLLSVIATAWSWGRDVSQPIVVRDRKGYPFFTKEGQKSEWSAPSGAQGGAPMTWDGSAGMWTQFMDQRSPPEPYYYNIVTGETWKHKGKPQVGMPWVDPPGPLTEGQKRYHAVFLLDKAMNEHTKGGWASAGQCSCPSKFGLGYEPQAPQTLPLAPGQKARPTVTGKHFIFCLDASGSMAGKGWKDLKNAYKKGAPLRGRCTRLQPPPRR